LFQRKTVSPPAIGRILLIKLAAMGDTIVLVPVFRALRQALPEARIEFLCSHINTPIARTIPYLDHIHVWDRPGPLPFFSVVQTLREGKSDVVVDLEQWARVTALLTALSNAPVRLGFDTPGQRRAALYTGTVKKDFQRHELDDFFNLVEKVAPLK